MAELLPVAQAGSLRATLLEYLGTTFSLTDPTTRRALEEFLTAPRAGLFRGPYVRLRLPFRPADPGWEDSLEWYGGPPPYGHQARAFQRLSSLDPATGGFRRPLPTLVTTGTGSGKTEAFLFPILDHVRRANRAGITGLKALILYPMNALANDQAQRLADLITTHPELDGVTAGLFTGESGKKRSKVGADGLITDRQILRDTPPDILLTNYKMLDQLLLRRADVRLWSASAQSLQYLVLDEFHTYDGAQGTDVAMLLRRLGLVLRSYRPTGAHTHPTLDEPVLGAVTPVATSATLGDRGDPSAMLDFARTVFGETFPPAAVITESRMTVDEWVGTATRSVDARGVRPIDADLTAAQRLTDAVARTGERRPGDTDALARTVIAHLYRVPPASAEPTDTVTADWPVPDLGNYHLTELLDLVKAHPLVTRLVTDTAESSPLSGLISRDEPEQYLTEVLNALSHLRKELGREALSVDVHLWVRELTRVGRAASGTPEFFWDDDGERTSAPDLSDRTGPVPAPLPAIYCRHCGRSGWMVALAPTGANLDTSGEDVRRRHLQRDERVRPLIYAPGEEHAYTQASTEGINTEQHDNLKWFHVDDQKITVTPPSAQERHGGAVLPVLTHDLTAGGKDSKDDVCPACGDKDGIRFLGSAIATLLSVTLSAMFGTPYLDGAEKKALIFTDSVQDAAHRAGFIQARSHALTLRALLRQALDEDQPVDLETLTRHVIDRAGNDQRARYRLMPPELTERTRFAEYWSKPTRKPSPALAKRIERRLALDVHLEHGLRSGVGRTLEKTGSVVAEVSAPAALLVRAARDTWEQIEQGTLHGTGPADDQLLGWVRGVLEHMRHRGAIQHDWFDKFRTSDGNRWWVTGGRKRQDGMPAFGRGSSAPGYPRFGGTPHKDSDLEPITSPRGWYVSWAKRCLNLDAPEAATASRLLFDHLLRRDVVGQVRTESGGITYHLAPSSILVRPANPDDRESGRLQLVCPTCGTVTHGSPTVVDQLVERPCLVAFCDGTLERLPVTGTDFYREMYASADPTRVVAREHTSILDDAVRLEYENAFKSTAPPANAPNVLVATPTLEMGIDIGDLSAVMLSSLPRSVASYLQRVGRAGRLTGNSLVLAFVTARGDQLPRFTDPLSVINGQVRPPATFLDAEEILRRQYLASIADVLARRAEMIHPRLVTDVLNSVEPGSYLGELIDEAEHHATAHLDAFLAGFPDLDPRVGERLRDWAQPASGEGRASSRLAARCLRATVTWLDRLRTLEYRRTAIQHELPELQKVAESQAATDADVSAWRTAQAALRLTNKQVADLTGEFWIAALESFGLFPNYTLIDDAVELDVSLSWIDPDTQEYHDERVTIERGSAAALREFAPGATFYGRGYAIEIDALDLGRGEESVREWTCCPECGFVTDTTDTTPPVACPRCGSTGIADVAQRVRTVELRRVSSVLRREEATIGDQHDERTRERFEIVTLPDIDPAATEQWFVEGYGFGARYARQMTLRWLNLGRSSERGQSVMIAGQAIDAAYFRVCEHCGKLDRSIGRNTHHDHRPWCPLRKQHREQTLAVALSRTLTTEGLVLRVPPTITLGNLFAMPSLQAAILLALRERMGGSPDHLAVTTITDPTPDPDVPNSLALLLHDTVPGGTGYLSELASPTKVWDMLHKAWEHLRGCPCRDEERIACEKCLLPFAPPFDVQWVSRAEAAAALEAILCAGAPPPDGVPAVMPWIVTQTEPDALDPESLLEQKFRAVLRTRLEAIGATIAEESTSLGTVWRFAVAGRRWTLEPQVDLSQGTRPDFVLHTADSHVPPTAIYTDGWRYHASPTHNRITDDAEKRERLRASGYQVLAFTWDDLTDADQSPPPWFDESVVGTVIASSGDGLSPGVVDLVRRTALDLLLAWIDDPDEAARATLATYLPGFFFSNVTGQAELDQHEELAHSALGWLDAGTASSSGEAMTVFWHSRSLVAAFRVFAQTPLLEAAVVLDDAATALGDDHKTSWREWLRISNLLNFRTVAPTTITTRSLVAGTPTPAVVPATDTERAFRTSGSDDGLAPEWRGRIDLATSDEKPVLLEIAGAGLQPPEMGIELDDGAVNLSLSWPSLHIAYDIDLDRHTREWLAAHGWSVVADLDQLRTALTH